MTKKTIENKQKEQELSGKKVLIIVENLPVPFDRRVWQEARSLHKAGAQVSIICPTGKGHEKSYELIEGIHIYRHPLFRDANGALGYLVEYGTAFLFETFLAWKIFFRHGFDIIHGCNPPDLIFLIAWQFKLFGKKFIFDHHDINPELFEAKFNKRGFFWKLICFFEWLTFKSANVVIATNESYKKIAITRGRKLSKDVFVVRSGPDLSRVKSVTPRPEIKNSRQFLISYVGVMGDQEGIDLLLEAAKYLIYEKGRKDIQFALVGSGSSLSKLKKLSKEMGLYDFVTFFGRAPDQILFETLSTADICVNPDRVNEMNDKSTMNKILEYMALGKPIVQFDVTEGRFSAQKASLYAKANDPVDFAHKIEMLLKDPKKRAEMGEFGRKRVESKMAWVYEEPKLVKAYLHAGK